MNNKSLKQIIIYSVILSLVIWIFSSIVIYSLPYTFILSSGNSMQPSLDNCTIGLYNQSETPEEGDIISTSYNTTSGEERRIVHRVEYVYNSNTVLIESDEFDNYTFKRIHLEHKEYFYSDRDYIDDNELLFVLKGDNNITYDIHVSTEEHINGVLIYHINPPQLYCDLI